MAADYQRALISFSNAIQAGATNRSAAPPSERFRGNLDETRSGIEDTDDDAWTEDERNAAREAAAALRDAIDNYLNPRPRMELS